MKLNRRIFLQGSAGLFISAAAHRLVVPPAQALNAELMFDGDMETASFKDYETFGDSSNMRFRAHGNTPVISTERSRAGTRSAKVVLNRKTSSDPGRTEAEAVGTKRQLEYRRTYWWGFSIFVPSDWIPSSTYEVVFQTHNNPLDWSIPLDYSPLLAIRFNAGSNQWRIVQRYVQAPEVDANGNPLERQQSDYKTAFDDLYGTVEVGRWTDWVFEYRPDWRSTIDGGVGVTRVWRNGTKLVDYIGPNCANEVKGSYLKWGCYKGGWKNRDLNDPVVERVYYYDQFRVSRPDAGSYGLVVPGASSTVEPRAPQLIGVS